MALWYGALMWSESCLLGTRAGRFRWRLEGLGRGGVVRADCCWGRLVG